ncbi:hypothetical protein DFQ30_000184 [Apophysomyces sp. BC1015]|nr:hypothetical protein DFQ30_000184 [Apophysomyces sp. BC1015]
MQQNKLVVALFQRTWEILVELGEDDADQEDFEEHEQDKDQERQATGDILTGTNGGDNDEENGDEDDEDDVFHRTHGGKLSKAKAARLIPFLIYFMERQEGTFQSFVLCPLQAHHRVALPFDVSFATILLTQIEHFSRPIIEQLEQEFQAGPNERRAHQLTREREDLQNACTRLQGIGRTDPFSAFFDIRRQAIITRDERVDVRDRGYMRIVGPANTGQYNQVSSRRGNTTCKCLTELRRTTRGTLKDTWERDSHGDQFDYLQHYDGVIGLDFGECVPTEGAWTMWFPAHHQASYLYGRTIPNRDWLEARKAANNIDDIEAAFSKRLPQSTYGRYQEYLRQLKANDNGLRLWKFYLN